MSKEESARRLGDDDIRNLPDTVKQEIRSHTRAYQEAGIGYNIYIYPNENIVIKGKDGTNLAIINTIDGVICVVPIVDSKRIQF